MTTFINPLRDEGYIADVAVTTMRLLDDPEMLELGQLNVASIAQTVAYVEAARAKKLQYANKTWTVGKAITKKLLRGSLYD